VCKGGASDYRGVSVSAQMVDLGPIEERGRWAGARKKDAGEKEAVVAARADDKPQDGGEPTTEESRGNHNSHGSRSVERGRGGRGTAGGKTKKESSRLQSERAPLGFEKREKNESRREYSRQAGGAWDVRPNISLRG